MALLRGCTLVLAAIALLLPASLHGAADDWHVGVRAGLIQPGDVLKLDIRPPDGITTVAARWIPTGCACSRTAA